MSHVLGNDEFLKSFQESCMFYKYPFMLAYSHYLILNVPSLEFNIYSFCKLFFCC